MLKQYVKKYTTCLIVLWLTIMVSGLAISIAAIWFDAFAPLQTSMVTEAGICMSSDEYEPVSIIVREVDKLYICGILSGETKRYVSFRVYWKGSQVFYTTHNLEPKLFYIPIEAEESNGGVFLNGQYQIDLSYARDPFMQTHFVVDMSQ